MREGARGTHAEANTHIKPRPSNRVHLIDKHDTGLLTTGQLEELTNHTGALTNVLLDCVVVVGWGGEGVSEKEDGERR